MSITKQMVFLPLDKRCWLSADSLAAHRRQKRSRRLRQTCCVKDRPRNGRPRVTTTQQDWYITLAHSRRWFLPVTATAMRYGISIAVRNRFSVRNNSIRKYRPWYTQIFTKAHQVARMNWFHRHLEFRRVHWKTEMSTYESRLNIRHADDVWSSIAREQNGLLLLESFRETGLGTGTLWFSEAYWAVFNDAL